MCWSQKKKIFCITSLIIAVVLNFRKSCFYKCSLESGSTFVKCSELSIVVLFILVFVILVYHRGVEDHFTRNVIMLLSEGLTETKINCTELIVCGRKVSYLSEVHFKAVMTQKSLIT